MDKDVSLQNKIYSWLETQGYTTEMKVAMSLRKAGIDVVQSHYYDDPETKISREIDIVGRIHDRIGLLTTYSIIECKKSQKPWILFTSEFERANIVTSFAITSEENRMIFAKRISDLVNINWFKKDGRNAFGITEAFTNKEDSTFKAGIGATKAAISLSQSTDFNSPGINLFFPTVVFEGQLFECYLDKDGNPEVNEINSSFLSFNVRFGNHAGASIHIVRLEAIDEYCQELNNTFTQLRKRLKEERVKHAIQLGMNPDSVED